jgi:hypothetical protein
MPAALPLHVGDEPILNVWLLVHPFLIIALESSPQYKVLQLILPSFKNFDRNSLGSTRSLSYPYWYIEMSAPSSVGVSFILKLRRSKSLN